MSAVKKVLVLWLLLISQLVIIYALEHATLKPYITKLINKQDLTTEETEKAWDIILTGPTVDGGDSSSASINTGALLVLLRSKGETPKELCGMVRSMKKNSKPVKIPGFKCLDIVGTGGDGADTINISTASIILCAACGCKVAKAGNRSVSSQCGSADVLQELGVVIDLTPEQMAECNKRCGVCFMFAPVNHPAMKKVAPVRKALGVRTAFNILGPITNAATAQHAVIGVFEESLVDLIGNALIEIGSIEHAVVVHGCGLDEISPLGASTIYEIRNTAGKGCRKRYETKRYEFDPLSVGIPRCRLADLKGGDKHMNARELRKVLKGGDVFNAKTNSVILNAGMGLYVYGLASSIEEGIEIARDVLRSGKGLVKLDEWIEVTQTIQQQSSSS